MTTARGVVVHRQNTRLWPKAHERYVAQTNRRRRRSVSLQMTSIRSSEAPAVPDVHEDTIRFWWDPPDRLREEVTSNIEHQSRTTIWNGELWWLYGDAMGAITNELLDEEERAHHGAGGGERFQPLLDPSWLIPYVEVDEIQAGDGLLRVRARMRDDLEGPHLHHVHLAAGADRYAFDVDESTGILRSSTATIDGEELSSTRLDELVLGETFPDELFIRPPDVEFERPGGHAGPVTLEEAAAEAPFPVFLVPELPDGVWRLRVSRIRKPSYTVWLVYHRSDARGSFSIGQSDEAVFDPDGDVIERDGATYVVAERTVAFERDGTKLVLQSDSLETEALLGLAASVKRVGP